MQTFPIIGKDECKRITQKYKGRQSVEDLAQARAGNIRSYSQDNFREIHDLFMDDYIRERRKEKNDFENIVFVTSNRELITFTEKLHPGSCYMISTSRLILDLWMHNASPADISSCALTETMARCLDQHNIRVRNKVVEVSRFFNQNSGHFDSQVYRDFIKQLYRRARNVIMAVECSPDDQDNFGENAPQRILDAVKADQEHYNKCIMDSEERNSELSNQLELKTQDNDNLTATNELHKRQIESLSRENKELTGQVSESNKKYELAEKQRKEEKDGRLKAEDRVTQIKRLIREKDKLNNELLQINSDLALLEIKRKKAFTNIEQIMLFVFGILFILSAIGIFRHATSNAKYGVIAIGVALVSIALFCFTRYCQLKDKKEERKEKALKRWEDKEKNKRYKILIQQKEAKQKRIKEILDEIGPA